MEYYFINQTDTSRDEMQKVTVGRAATHKLTYQVDEVGNVLTWEFVTSSFDIGFGVFFVDKDGQKHAVVCCTLLFSTCMCAVYIIRSIQFLVMKVTWCLKWVNIAVNC